MELLGLRLWRRRVCRLVGKTLLGQRVLGRPMSAVLRWMQCGLSLLLVTSWALEELAEP